MYMYAYISTLLAVLLAGNLRQIVTLLAGCYAYKVESGWYCASESASKLIGCSRFR